MKNSKVRILRFLDNYQVNLYVWPALIVLIALLLLPFTTNGIWFDDALNSQIFYYLKKEEIGLFDFSFSIFHLWLDSGRLMFGYFIGYPLFYLFHEPIALRLAHIFCTLLNLALWGILLKSYGMSRRQIYLWILFVVALFQVQPAGDPVGGFAFHYQILGLLLGISLFWLSKYFLTTRRIYLYSSLGAWFFSMLLYEVNIIFIPMAICLMYVAHKNGFKHYLFGDIGFLFSGLFIYIAIYFLIKYMAITPAYDGASLNISSSSLNAYIKQIFNTLPLTFWIFSDFNTNSFLMILKNYFSVINILVIVLSVYILHAMSRRENLKFNYSLGVIFTCMLFLPALIPSISLRYQNQINWGWPALTIYYQIFGLAYLFVLIFEYLSKYKYFNINIIIISFYISFNFSVNYSTAAIMDISYKIPRDSFIDFINANISDFNDGDAILFSPEVPTYITTTLIFSQTNKYLYEIASPGRVKPSRETPKGVKKFEIFRDGVDKYRMEPLK